MRKSTATEHSNQLGDWSKWAAKKSNRQFFTTAIETMHKFNVGNRGLMTIGLVGARDIPGVVLRRAQSILRWDQRPSHWSHAFLIGRTWKGKGDINKLPIYEIPLFSRNSGFPRPENNGVTPNSTLGLYSDANIDANVALICVVAREFKKKKRCSVTNLSNKDVKAIVERAKDYNYDRLRYDFWNSLSVWHRYLWSEGEGRNPLREGFPICASSYVEMAFEAIGLDLVPSTSERNSAPEHIWNAARWWYQHSHLEHDDTESAYEMVGCYAIRDPGCSIISANESSQ